MNATLRQLLATTLLMVTASGLQAQIGVTTDPGSSVRTRADLESLLLQYEQVLASPAYSDEIKGDTRRRAEQVRSRLEDGDFRLGDAVELYVEGEPTLPDTVFVQSSAQGPIIVLPVYGEIQLRGVLRSEITAHITDYLDAFIRTPVVRASGLMRLSVQGAVAQPGFYVVPADMLISQALMVAGGPGQTAEIDELRIERGSEVLLEGDELQEELRLGRTLDQLNLQAGDQLMLPQGTQGGGFFQNLGVVVGLVSTISILVLQLSR